MKFSIITPAWNVEHWIPETLESVLSQEGDFEIEYIVVTDPSSDGTVRIAKEYQNKVMSGAYPIKCNNVHMQVVERDGGSGSGMYLALNDGFARATGEIEAWIAGDDIYQPGAFKIMAKAFAQFPDIEWLKGMTATIGEHSEVIYRGFTRIYHQDWLRWGVYGMESYHVEQDSVFWRAPLWKKGGSFPAIFKSSGDYWLWIQFAKFAPLWTINAPISCFRKREGQDSRANAHRLLQQKLDARGGRPLGAWIPRLFFWPYFHAPDSWKIFFEWLYPIIFPFRKREYIEIEGGTLAKHTMKSFFIRQEFC